MRIANVGIFGSFLMYFSYDFLSVFGDYGNTENSEHFWLAKSNYTVLEAHRAQGVLCLTKKV